MSALSDLRARYAQQFSPGNYQSQGTPQQWYQPQGTPQQGTAPQGLFAGIPRRTYGPPSAQPTRQYPQQSALPTSSFNPVPGGNNTPQSPPFMLPGATSLGLGVAQFGLNAADKGFGAAYSNLVDLPEQILTLPGRAYDGISSLFSPSPAPPATYGSVAAGPPSLAPPTTAVTPDPMPDGLWNAGRMPGSGVSYGGSSSLAATPRLPQFAGRGFTPTTLPSGMQGGPAAGAANAGTGASFLGSAASALGGAGSGMFVNSLFDKQNVGSQVGAAIGGTLGSFLPVPYFGPYLGGFVGGRIGSLFGPGASVGPNGNASLDLKDGVISIDNIGTDNGQDSAQIRELSEGMLDGINKMSSDGLVKFNKLVGSPSVFKQKTGLRVFDGSPDGKWVPAESGADLMTEMLFYNLVTGNAEVTDPAKLRETVGLMGGSATDRINTILDHQEAGTFEPATTQAMRKSDQINTGLSQTKPEGFARSGIGRATKNAVENFPGAGSYITQDDMRKSWNRTRGLLEGAPLRHPSLSELRTDGSSNNLAARRLGGKGFRR